MAVSCIEKYMFFFNRKCSVVVNRIAVQGGGSNLVYVYKLVRPKLFKAAQHPAIQ